MSISAVPRDVLLYTFSFLEGKEVGQIARVCKLWNQINHSEVLWKSLTKRDFPFADVLSEAYKETYKWNYQSQKNLKNSYYSYETIANDHLDFVNCLALNKEGNTLYTGSVGGSIKIFHLKEAEKLKKTLEEGGMLHALAISEDEKQLYCGYAAGLSIIDLNTYKSVFRSTDYALEAAVNNLLIVANKLILSCRFNDRIYIWDLENGIPKSYEPIILNDSGKDIFERRAKRVLSLGYNHKYHKLVATINDGQIKIFNLKTSLCERVISDCGRNVCMTLTPDGEKIIVENGGIQILNFHTGVCERVLEADKIPSEDDGEWGNSSLLACSGESEILFSQHDKSIEIWSLKTGSLLSSILHGSNVWSLLFNPKSWELFTGDDIRTLTKWSFAHVR